MAKHQILLTGTGGQGLILAAIMLAEAAVAAGKNVLQTQSFGPEARGGASKAEVIISDSKIYYPKVMTPDLVLTMSFEAFRKYGVGLKSESLLLIDTTFVQEDIIRPHNRIALPITRLTRKEFGSDQSANVVALGIIAALTNLLPKKNLKEAVLNRSPKGSGQRNLSALELGWMLGLAELDSNNLLGCQDFNNDSWACPAL